MKFYYDEVGHRVMLNDTELKAGSAKRTLMLAVGGVLFPAIKKTYTGSDEDMAAMQQMFAEQKKMGRNIDELAMRDAITTRIFRKGKADVAWPGYTPADDKAMAANQTKEIQYLR